MQIPSDPFNSGELAVRRSSISLLDRDGEGGEVTRPPLVRVLPRMLSIAEVAEMFGRAPRTIRSWIARGLFQPVRIGHAVFIPEAQLDALSTSSQPMKLTPPGLNQFASKAGP